MDRNARDELACAIEFKKGTENRQVRYRLSSSSCPRRVSSTGPRKYEQEYPLAQPPLAGTDVSEIKSV